MSLGSLLQRNTAEQKIDVVVISQEEGGGSNDPFSPDFKIPEWVFTPYDLITYFNECLAELVLDGQPRTLTNYAREIRPARKLLKCGVDVATRVCRLTAQETFGDVSLYRALDRVETIQQARHTTD